MKGWVVKIAKSYGLETDAALLGVTTWNSGMKDVQVTSPLVYEVCTGNVDEKDYSEGKVWVFEDKDEAKEFVEILKRFQSVNFTLMPKYSIFTFRKFKIVPVEFPEMTYADFDQIMESFDGFEEEMEKSMKALKAYSKKLEAKAKKLKKEIASN